MCVKDRQTNSSMNEFLLAESQNMAWEYIAETGIVSRITMYICSYLV